MKTHYVYKLTDQSLRTHGGFQWSPKVWAPPLKGTRLCAPGIYHAYHTPELALLLNPIHANIKSPRLWKVEVRGNIVDADNGLKLGATEMRLVEEIPFTPPTTEQRVHFALLCAKAVYKDPAFKKFADNWISGKDRTEKTAKAAWAAAKAAWAAAKAAWAWAAAAAAAEAAEAAAAKAAWAAAAGGAWAAAAAAAEAAEAAAEAAEAVAGIRNPLKMLTRCAKQALS